jgi:hypothetical protein
VTLPERLGRLRRVDRIGAGGFATVWLYHDDDLDSPVAVKALADNWAQRADVRERFLEEARMLRRADSAHVVRVYDIGEADQTPYFVMSYADLGSLATLTDAGPVDPRRAVDLICQAGEGVHFLHRRGIIHRDIKPQNLLLSSGSEDSDDGERVLVADLGVAKAMLHASGLTQVVGTPAYMAPEQAIGLGVDVRADVHALGAVAYHLMTGRFAREGGIGDLADPKRPAAPSTIEPALAPYDDVLLRALEPRPDDRWPDVPSFVRALRGVTPTVVHEPVAPPTELRTLLESPTTLQPSAAAVREAEPEEPVAPPRRGGSLRAVVLALAGVVLVAGGAITALALTDRLDGLGAGGGTPTTGATSPPTVVPAPDITFEPLGFPVMTEFHTLVAPGGSRWTYAVPDGWAPTDPATKETIPPQELDKQTEVRWRPEGEPPIGGYSVRYLALKPTQTVTEMRDAQLADLIKASYPGFHVFRKTADGLWFTYIDGFPHLRYNYFRWIAAGPGHKAGMEISVVGRKVDKANLEVLINQAAERARPVS